MSKPHQQWTVLPHGELVEIDDGIFTVVGHIKMPLMDLPRRMTVIRLANGRLVVWSAIALDERQMSKLDSIGRPAFLVVPNDHHRLDAKAWKQRYQDLQVVAPQGSRATVAEVVPVDTSAPTFDDPDVEFVTVPGTRDHEAAMVVRRAQGTTLILNDLVGNIRDASGFDGWLLRLAGFAGDKAKIPAVVKFALVKDAKDLEAQLLRWADIEALKRILVSHGEPIETNARQTLRELAGSL